MIPLPPSFWGVFPACLALAAASLWWLADRATSDRRLRWIALGSFGLRVGLGAALFIISEQRWALFRSLQAAPGFWVFGLDSPTYHHYAMLNVDAWRRGLPLPNPGIEFEYFAIVAAVYRFVGAHPLYPVLLNCWLASATGLLAFLIGRRLFDHRAALTAAALVSFWPSSLLWSSQLLKDPLTWCLTFTILYLLLLLAPGASHGSGAEAASARRPWRTLALWAGLGLSVLACTRLRFYLGMTLSAAALVVLGPAAALAAWRGQARRGRRYAGVLVAVILCTLLARTLNTYRLLSPRQPDRGHIGRAVESWQRGALVDAIHHFEQARAWDPREEEAYLGLAAVYLRLGGLHEAALFYQQHLHYKHFNFTKRPEVEAMLLRLREALESPRPEGDAPRMAELSAAAAALSSLAPGRHPTRESRLDVLTQSLARLGERLRSSVAEATPRQFDRWRASFVHAGGRSVVDPDRAIATVGQLAAYLPRALAVSLLAPFPWQWLELRGSTGSMRLLSGLDMLLLYWLLTALPFGLRELLRRRSAAGLVITVFIALLAAGLSLVVANLGILFRLRLLFVLPLAVVASGGDPLGRARQAVGWLRRRRARPLAAGEAVSWR